jgi:hypothetical protein
MRRYVDGCRTIVSGGQGEGAYLTALLFVLARASEEQPWTAVCLRRLLFSPVASLSLRLRPHAHSACFSRNLALLSPLALAFLWLSL